MSKRLNVAVVEVALRAICAVVAASSVVASTFLAPNAVEGAQTRVVMKDGRLLTGQIFPTKSVVETYEMRKDRDSAGTERIIAIDDQLRRIYVPKNNIADMIVDDSGAALEVFKVPQRINASQVNKIVSLGSYRVNSDFDEFGRRVITAGGVPIVQGITEIAPSYVRVQGLTAPLDMRLSPLAIPRETLSTLIRRQINAKSLDDRLRVYQFYVQATLYEQAADELQEIIDDFQDDEDCAQRLEIALRLIKQMAAERLLKELELRRAAGQHKRVKELLDAFETDRVSPEKLQAIRSMRRLYEGEDRKRAYLVERISSLVEQIKDEDLKKTATSLVAEIQKELNSNTLSRFGAFDQAENDQSLNDEQRLALALSGWLVGNVGADNRLEVALSLYRVRQLVRKYLLESRKGQRDLLWSQIIKEEATSPKQISLILENMKPPKSPPRSSRETPYQYEISVPSFQDDKTFVYSVQLPPEYDPNRKYPTVVSLHGERTSPEQQLNWWCGPWVEKTNAQGKVVRERYGQATRYGYIVVAPKWTEPAQRYDFSATACAAVLYCLRDAERTFSIDTDRVFLSGYLAGGDLAWDVALAHPDLWAGVIPICGRATGVTERLRRNGEFVPLYGIGGELDGGTLADSRLTLDWGMDLSRPFDMTYVQFKGRGAERFSEEIMRVFEWMSVRSRAFYSVDERVVYSARPWDNFFWNVELFDFNPKTVIDPLFEQARDLNFRPAETEFFKIAGNSLRIKSSAKRAVIFLSPDQIDFDRKTEILFNMRKLNTKNSLIPTSSRVMLEDARTRCDRQRPFWASINSSTGKINEWDD